MRISYNNLCKMLIDKNMKKSEKKEKKRKQITNLFIIFSYFLMKERLL